MEFVISCLILGAVVGFLGSLFGIGGGTIIVPVLLWLLPKTAVPVAYVMYMSLGTSFVIIIFTSLASSYQHYQLGNIDFSKLKIFIPSLMCSALMISIMVGKVNPEILKLVFASLLLCIALKMLYAVRPSVSKTVANQYKKHFKFNTLWQIIAGCVVGGVSSIAGIGGGVLMVPLFHAVGMPMNKAIGSSSFCGIFLALLAATGFVISGFAQPSLPDYTLGYVYLPVVVLVASTIIITAKIGARLTVSLPVKTLKASFAVFLCMIAAYMLFQQLMKFI